MIRVSNEGVSVPREAVTNGPEVTWNHIDGPLLYWASQIHWLTWRQRLRIWLGLATVDAIACEQWPHIAKLRTRLLKEAA